MNSPPGIRVSVTALANFVCRVGDLMPQGVAGPTAREGMRAHKRIQNQVIMASEENALLSSNELAPAGNDAQTSLPSVSAEVSLSCQNFIEQYSIELGGRVDLIDRREHKLSEIKTTLVPSDELPESQRSLQWAQLYLYGFLYIRDAADRGVELESVKLELIHVNLRTQSNESDCRIQTSAKLEQHAHTTLLSYVRWVSAVELWREQCSLTAATLEFPHADFRAGQRDMAAAVYRATRDSQGLMCEAPTGIGKTISVLFPSAKALGDGAIKQVIYLTAKVAGRLSAMQSLSQLHDGGLRTTAIQIRSKQSVCFCSNGSCERDDSGRCPMTLGFFDRLPAARDELLAAGIITDKFLDEIAWQYQLCPFELALQLLPWMQVIVADYNYVFDPLVRLPHFSEPRPDTLLLVDEAHNLVERSRSMYSADLSREQCRKEAMDCRLSHPIVANSLDKLSQYLLKHARTLDDGQSVSDQVPSSVSRAAAEVVESIMASMDEMPLTSDTSSDLFRILCRFVAISELFSEKHRCITDVIRVGQRKQVSLSLYCLDAGDALHRQYKMFKSQIFFSATLRPATFYRDTLSLPKSTSLLQLASPFDEHHVFRAVVGWVNTRYRQREKSMPDLLDLIWQVCSRRKGNYLIFFPSYAYLESVHKAFVGKFPQADVWRQEADQRKEDQQNLLDEMFRSGQRIGFVILGGVFGEGIDYQGNSLIGVVVIGVGLPGLDVKTQIVSDHYQTQGYIGYDFTYRYPGFTRVLQSVGRLIRSETDKGVVVLVDDRFSQSFYRELFPASWRLCACGNQVELVKKIEAFWSDANEQVVGAAIN